MANQDRRLGGRKEAPLVVRSSRLGSNRQQEQIFTREDAEFQRYSELLAGFFEKFTKWQVILAAEECKYSAGYRGFSVYRSGNGSIIRPGLVLKETDNFKDKDKLLSIQGYTGHIVDVPAIQFHIMPGQAGRHLLTDPEDQRTLEQIVIELFYNPASIFMSKPLEIVEICTARLGEKLKEGEDFYSTSNRQARYELHGDTLTVNRFHAGGSLGVMTDETAAALINSIDALIPGIPTATQHPEQTTI